jgi:general secretion pathway protein J
MTPESTTRPSRRPCSQAGFTLLELLVALTVFSLLMLGLTQGLRFGLQGWEAESRESRNLAELDSVDRLLRGLLTSIQVRTAAGFSGDIHSMRFVGSLPRAAPPGIRVATISLLVSRDGRLILSWTPPTLDTGTKHPPPPQITPILDNVAAIHCAYYADARSVVDGKSGKAAWRMRWNGSDGIPELVRIHIDFAEGDPRHWPDFVVAPMVSGDQPPPAAAASATHQ